MEDKVAQDREEAVEANLEVWDSVVEAHAASEMYDLEGFLAGDNHLGETERREVDPVEGKRLLHLLCHFGLDTLSWARLGAEVTGLDISPQAIAKAREIAALANLDATFIESDIAHAKDVVDGPFDIVFMSWGAICWVPDIDKLFSDVAELLAPGGFYYLLDAHPLTNAIDDTWTVEKGHPIFPEPYGSEASPVCWDWQNYADGSPDSRGKKCYDWPHSNAQVVTALAKAGLRIAFLHDHDYLVWEAAPGLVEGEDGHWRWPEGVNPLPLSYSVKAVKP